MNAVLNESPRTARYAQVVRISKKSEWQIDRDLLQDREFDFNRNFLPAGLSRVDTIPYLTSRDSRLLSQIQGRTYAYIFGLVERFISAKMMDQGRAHALDDQNAMEALVRFTNDELKHQELFRRVEQLIGEKMPMGYRQVANASDVARAVLAASTWSVLALTCHIELFVQSHYVESIVTTADLCPLFKDVFMCTTGRTRASMCYWMNSSGKTNTSGYQRRSAIRRWTISSRWSARSTASCRRSPRRTWSTSRASPRVSTVRRRWLTSSPWC